MNRRAFLTGASALALTSCADPLIYPPTIEIPWEPQPWQKEIAAFLDARIDAAGMELQVMFEDAFMYGTGNMEGGLISIFGEKS